MFEALIDEARNLIQRLHASAEQGRDAVSESVRVRFSELEAWDAASHGIVELIFGADSPEATRWRGLTGRRATLAGEAMRKDIKRGEYFGLIDYFHLAIGALLEFDAWYNHRQAGAQGQARASGALVDHSVPPAAQQPTAPLSPAPPSPAAPSHEPAAGEGLGQSALGPSNGQPPVARAVNGGWELTIAVSGATYRWLADVATARDADERSEDAAARLAATIVERVAANTRAEKRHG